MTAFQVNYSINGNTAEKDFEANDLNDAYLEMVKVLQSQGISAEQFESAAVKVKNLATEEEYLPNSEESTLVSAQ